MISKRVTLHLGPEQLRPVFADMVPPGRSRRRGVIRSRRSVCASCLLAVAEVATRLVHMMIVELCLASVVKHIHAKVQYEDHGKQGRR